jgi:UDP-N-acetylglucosamine 1-carboxyvinyltransferase
MIALLEKSVVGGEVKVSGSKNAFFPAVGAGIALGAEKIIIKNTPKIKDVFVMLELLKELGCEYKIQNSEVIINAEKIKLNDVYPENFGKIGKSKVKEVKTLLEKVNDVNYLKKIKRKIIEAKTWEDFVKVFRNHK